MLKSAYSLYRASGYAYAATLQNL